MGSIETARPVKLICGVLANSNVDLDRVKQALEGLFGEVDMQSGTWPFTYTAYYNDETGPEILRTFYSFRKLFEPGGLAAAKIQTNGLEVELGQRRELSVARPVNLDPGYVDEAKLVLATTKDYSHRIYIGKGIYAEVTLQFRKGRFEAWPWTYPDYRSDEYSELFGKVREHYIEALRRTD